MDFIQIQIIIFATMLMSSLLGGKKALIIATLIWVIETIVVYRGSHINYLQVIIVSLAFQISIVIAIARDFIIKKLKNKSV